MTKTIEQLWNGTLEPINYLGKDNKDLKQLESLIQRNLEKLEKGLNENQQEILKKFNDCTNEYITLISEQAFCDGFSIGAKITVEALNNAEQLLKNGI